MSQYPVLTGVLMDVARRLTLLLGGQTGPGLPEAVVGQTEALFFGVNALLLFGLFLWWCCGRTCGWPGPGMR